MRFFERFVVTHYITLDRQEPDVHLHLAGEDAAVVGVRPLRIQVLPLVERWVVEGWHGQGFLHRAFYQTVRERKTAREGYGLGNQVYSCRRACGDHINEWK